MNFLEVIKSIIEINDPAFVARSIDDPTFSLQYADDGCWNELRIHEQLDNKSGEEYYNFEYNKKSLFNGAVPVKLVLGDWEVVDTKQMPRRPQNENDIMIEFDAEDITDEELEEIKREHEDVKKIEKELKSAGTLASVLGFTDDEIKNAMRKKSEELDLDKELPPPPKNNRTSFKRIR